MEDAPLIVILGLVLSLIFFVVLACIMLSLFRPWLRAMTSGTPVSLITILGMRARGNRPDLIISAYTSLVYGGEDVSIRDVESVYIANRGTIRDAQDLTDLVRREEPARRSSDRHAAP